VHVEDHPIENIDFEGVIPAGEYGGGDVIVWDRGYWEPHGTDDPVAAVAAGELHIDVYGEKLAGRLVLIRRGKDRSGKEQWLLFHKRDEHAVAGWDPEAFPRSVPSGRTNDEVAAGADAVWLSDAPAAEAEVDLRDAREEDLPDFVPPMLAGRRKAPAADDDWLYELRWEGRRVEARVAVRDGGPTVALLDEDGQPLTEMFPELTRSASWLSARRALVDGVIVALDEEGRPAAEAMARRMAAGDGPGPRPPVAYQVFDLLHLDGRSLLEVPLESRKRMLRSVLRTHPAVRFTSHVEGDGLSYAEAAHEMGLPGVVAKRRDSPYRPGKRSADWRLLEVEKGSSPEMSAAEGDSTTPATRSPSSAKTRRRRAAEEPAQLVSRLVSKRVSQPASEMAKADNRWAPPTPEELRALDELGQAGKWDFQGRTLALTNLNKVLFPAVGDRPAHTKRDLIRYFAQIAPVMLPYLIDRPVNLHRYPNGVDRPGFWHKSVPDHAPDWLRRWDNVEADPGETKTYFVIDSPPALAWMGNYGAVELHPWTSTIRDVHQPTYALIDIDPGKRTSWDEVVLMAETYRVALEQLRVFGAPKVTGQRGIQIWVPIRPGYTFEDTRTWVERLSRAVGSTFPELISWAWEVRARRGLARLDYTQNAINKTLVAPYSARPAPGAPVSMPIEWSELHDPQLRPDRWTINDALGRVGEVGDLFAHLREHADQELPPL
jgi:DNA ligase D-like protein (predicted polymerase)